MSIAEIVRGIAQRVPGVRVIYSGERFTPETVTETHVRLFEGGTDRLSLSGSKGQDRRAGLEAEEQIVATIYARSKAASAKVAEHRALARSLAYGVALSALETLHAQRMRWVSAEGRYIESDDAQPSQAIYELTITYLRGVDRAQHDLADSPVADLSTLVTDGTTTQSNC